jgi:hypothetical protein
LRFVKSRKGLFGSKRFLRFPLDLFDVGTAEFALMLFEVQIKTVLGIEVLVADIAFNKTSDRGRLLYLYLFYRFLP